MDGSFVQTISAAAVGAAVVAVGGAALVIRVLFCRTLTREIDEEYRNRHRC